MNKTGKTTFHTVVCEICSTPTVLDPSAAEELMGFPKKRYSDNWVQNRSRDEVPDLKLNDSDANILQAA